MTTDQPKKRREHVGRTIHKEIRIAASPAEVWDAWAKADRISQWFVDRCEGDMQAGGQVTWCFDAFGYAFPIDVYEAERGKRLVFGGEIEGRPPALQEVILEQDGGYTVLRLANSGFGEGAEWDEEYEGTDSGWVVALETLKHWLEHFSDRPRTAHFRMAPAAFEYDAVQPFFATPEGLRAWLAESVTASAEELEVGGKTRLTFRDGSTLDGEVVARTHREVLLTWPERDGLLALKSFAYGPAGRRLGVLFDGWGLDAAGLVAVRGILDPALDRLVARFPATEPA